MNPSLGSSSENKVSRSNNYPSLASGAIAGVSLVIVVLAGFRLLPSTSTFWYLSRSAGLVAYTLLWLDLMTGVLLSGRSAKYVSSASTAAAFHQALATSALGFSLFHALVLLGDKTMGGSLKAALVPFVTNFHPVAMAFGQLATWLLGILIVTTYLRKTIGYKVWQKIHLTAYATYWLALAHALTLGTDIAHPLPGIYFALTGALALMLTISRILTRGGKRGK